MHRLRIPRPARQNPGALMPTRMIREGLLDSEKYWSVTIEARQLFWHLLLLADDLGCVSLAPAFVRRRCFDDGPAQDKIDRLVQQLMDADLIRIYEHSGARYGFIPRFGQRLKLMRLKHPEPLPEILEGDEDAKRKFREIKEKARNPAATWRADGRHMAAIGQPEEKGSEVELNTEEEVEVERGTNPNAKKPLSCDSTPMPRWWDSEAGVMDAATKMGISARRGESHSQLKGRVFEAISNAKKHVGAH
jgi:hypothetical protein